jgi:hypothetical protein
MRHVRKLAIARSPVLTGGQIGSYPEYDVIVGVDASLTDTGIVVIKYHEGKWITAATVSTAHAGKLPDIEREYTIVTIVMNVVNEFVRDANVGVVIEDHAYSRNTGKARTRAELIGVIKYLVLTICGVDVFLVAPSAVKRFMDCADKKKRSDKDAMFEACSRRFNFTSVNNNLVDAYCLARYLAANREGQRLNIIKHSKRLQFAPVQAPALRVVRKPAKNLRLTIQKRGATVRLAR